MEIKKDKMGLIPFCPVKSGWRDSNPRPPAPHAGAIPGYATSRKPGQQIYKFRIKQKRTYLHLSVPAGDEKSA